MADATCSIDGCDRPAANRGWCRAHYERQRKTGDLNIAVPVTPRIRRYEGGSQCSVDSCENSPAGRGLCRAHYARWQDHGDVLAEVPVNSPRSVAAHCKVGGCEKPPESRGWCGMHYFRWRKHGDPLFVREKPTACSADDCENSPQTRGLCEAHYARLLRYGDPEGRPSPKPHGEVSYSSFHRRLRKARGGATGYECITCGGQAKQWAWTHGEDPSNFDSYRPMCVSCHAKYDAKRSSRAAS